MKGLLLTLVVLLAGLIALSAAKPQTQSSEPKINYLKYKNEAEADNIIQSIIAQYEQLGGTSEFHNVQAGNQYSTKK
ncbi:uncharacterized protein LOC129916203 [Episyrphus balteatus]|uniref:uncharacterized protein LOC129916203 n=1 Tax=Episyrphus balteatus TaxID=286459 RepID=UPI00248507B1|nr:uncharacterized protein LOC129916203 [Episyrphus balteatus]